MALVQALYMDQGADFSTGITLYADGGMVPLDMTGYTFKAQMRKSYMSSTAYTFTCTVSDPASLGIVILTMSSSTTETIKPGRYLYDIEMVDDTGYKTRPVEGVVIVSPQITQI